MMRMCPQCKEKAIKVRVLSLSDRMDCEKCFFQYEYTTLSRWMLVFLGAFVPLLAIMLGTIAKSWWVFGIVLVVVPFLGELWFARYCFLKPVGVRALREKLRGKNC